MSANLASAIERFDDPQLLGEGKINIISLEAVAERLGARWPMRQEQVYDHAARTLEKNIGVQGYFARISDTDFLICQPEHGRYMSQVACLRSLREILTYFLGDAQAAGNGVHQVTKLSKGGITAEKVDANHVEREGEREEAAHRSAARRRRRRRRTDYGPMVALRRRGRA